MPLGLATSLSGFTSLDKEVSKVGFEVGHLSAHVTISGSLEPIVVRGSFGNSLRVQH